MEEGDGLRTRSFRNEDYNTRRVFLRSYPLQFDNDDDDQETRAPATPTHSSGGVRKGVQGTCEFARGDQDKREKKKLKMKKKKEAMKKMMVTIVEWGGGRIVVLRRFKHKISYYVVACFPIVFKPPKSLISAY